MRAWCGWWVACAALWLALVGTVALPELVAGALAAAVAATGAVLVRQHRPGLVRPRVAWIPRALRASAGLVADLPLLVRVLWRRGVLRRDEQGTLVERPFAAVDVDDRDQAGERVTAQLLGSLTPATVALDVDVDRGVLVEHRLEEA